MPAIASHRATVAAAESGVVAYAGNELRGFGNLLLIKHADGFMTAYAHNDALLVTRGQKVRKGEAIARVGSSGSVGEYCSMAVLGGSTPVIFYYDNTNDDLMAAYWVP